MCQVEDLKIIFTEIKSDNYSGSGNLLGNLISDILECSDPEQGASDITVPETIQLFSTFRDEMNDFAVITHFCDRIIENLKNSPEVMPDLKRLITEYNKKWNNVNDRIADNFINNINISGKTVLLHSQSSAIISLFKKLKERAHEIDIIQTESRPVLEGRKQAEENAQMGFRVRIVTDTGFTPLLDEIDMAILGADRIYEDVFINKTGSYAIALLCREKNIPVYVLADSRKFLKSAISETQPEKPRPAGEIWNDPPQNISPVNYYFEAVPINLATVIFTEKDQ